MVNEAKALSVLADETMDIEGLEQIALQAFDASDPLFYPNIRRILQILVALPVMTAKAERSLSTLRRLKTYLRATMSQARLVGLALLYSHREVTVDVNQVIRRFALSSTHNLCWRDQPPGVLGLTQIMDPRNSSPTWNQKDSNTIVGTGTGNSQTGRMPKVEGRKKKAAHCFIVWADF
ncbi:hypothetical protein HPB47_024904 [Ixodes persulcatus]|uniref:Uncharacterized protein n=1 Tax=Ixodes persulcatus TaxID=34615 RepID=A0AC60Q3I6_IXOPE|nr:hypothetical protein HPB47_024904 [Ixodes persulcatus]